MFETSRLTVWITISNLKPPNLVPHILTLTILQAPS